jgi:probable phosphoglycerate mutase
MGDVFLVRHGETEWSRSGRHTGSSDVPLTERGREEARRLVPLIRSHRIGAAFVSPLQRARETAELIGLHDVRVDPDLREWDYGAYEGRTTDDIRGERPDWLLWRNGCPGGEQPVDVGRRADRVIALLRQAAGDVIVFAHGHILRVLAARWVGLAPAEGSRLALDPATISMLGYEREMSVICLWNEDPSG